MKMQHYLTYVTMIHSQNALNYTVRHTCDTQTTCEYCPAESTFLTPIPTPRNSEMFFVVI